MNFNIVSMVIVAILCFLTISSAFDSSEIRMIEEEYDKRDPLHYMGDIIGESEKRARLDNPLIRFGKRAAVAYGMEREIRNSMQMDPLIRFGKRSPYDGAPLIRFGKHLILPPLIRFGKRAAPSAMLSAPHIRFGKRDFNDVAYSRFSRNRPNPADQDLLLRFGRSTPATMTNEEK
uniref:Uncharacterized protein n=1 Tax=Panagrolaimus sp. PS1159 TaxID=55785 RepID=A0AC35F5V8_9BILA